MLIFHFSILSAFISWNSIRNNFVLFLIYLFIQLFIHFSMELFILFMGYNPVLILFFVAQ